ncbi:MAG: CotH kinase family protein [Actinomycetota bacterium]|nr:CotH kinase family protein [Actinomycetota bacterium]
MFKKRDIAIIIVLIAALAGALFLYWWQRPESSLGGIPAVIDHKSQTIMVRLDPNADPRQEIRFNFLLNNHRVYIQNPETGETTKIRSGNYYDFKSYISHSRFIVGRTEYDLWVTTGTLPLISVNTGSQDIPNEPKIPCIMSAYDQTMDTGITADIETVNNYRDCPQPSYSFNLSSNPFTAEPSPLLDYGSSTNFILSSTYLDPSLMREKLAYDLFSMMSGDHPDPKPSYVELVLNGDYQGIYLLYQRHSGPLFSVNGEQGMLFEASGWQANLSHRTSGFSQVEPQSPDMLYTIDRLADQVQKQNIPEAIDLDSAADNYLLYLFTGCSHPLAPYQFIYQSPGQDQIRFLSR